MKKIVVAMLALILVFGSSAFAQTGDTTDSTQEEQTDTTGSNEEQTTEDQEDDGVENDEDEDEDSDDQSGKGKGKGKGKQKGQGNGKKGLENALEHVKGTPAESVIISLLEKYETPEELAENLDELEELLAEQEESAEEEATEDEDTDAEDETTEDETTEDETTEEETADENADENADEDTTEEDVTEETEDNEIATDEEENTDEDATNEEEQEDVNGEQNGKTKKNKEMIQLAKQILKDVQASDSPKTKKGLAYKKLAQFFAENQEWVDAIQSQESLLELEGNLLEYYELLGQLYKEAGLDEISAFVNGKKPEFDVPPIIKDGRTLVPLRAISEALDAEVSWDEETKTVTLVRDGVEVALTIGNNTATINGQEVELDVPASILNGRTVVPARFIAEALNADVEWVPEGQIVVISDGEGEEETDTEENAETTDEETTEATDETTTDETTTDNTVQ